MPPWTEADVAPVAAVEPPVELAAVQRLVGVGRERDPAAIEAAVLEFDGRLGRQRRGGVGDHRTFDDRGSRQSVNRVVVPRPGRIGAPDALFVVADRVTTTGSVGLTASLSQPASWQTLLVDRLQSPSCRHCQHQHPILVAMPAASDYSHDL